MPEFFSIVVPIHNEADMLETAVDEMQAALAAMGAQPKIYLVENGSTDATRPVAQRLADERPDLQVSSLDRADYGAAMRTGLLQARGEWVVTFDLDYYSAEFISELGELRSRADVVIASKRAPGSEDRRSLLRRAGTRVFNLLIRVLLGTRVTDTHGIKAISRDVIERLAQDVISTQDLFDTELVLRAERAGYRIVEVPITVQETRAARSSYLRRVPRAVAGVFRLRSALASERRNTKSR